MIKGSIVAIVTPMFEDGSLDRNSLRKLLDWHVAEGTDAICIVGTTGESATVTPEEHCELIKLAVDQPETHPLPDGTDSILALVSSSESRQQFVDTAYQQDPAAFAETQQLIQHAVSPVGRSF